MNGLKTKHLDLDTVRQIYWRNRHMLSIYSLRRMKEPIKQYRRCKRELPRTNYGQSSQLRLFEQF